MKMDQLFDCGCYEEAVVGKQLYFVYHGSVLFFNLEPAHVLLFT